MSASASRCTVQLPIGQTVITRAWTAPPSAQIRPWPSAAGTLTGSWTTTSITETVLAATTPAVGPIAHISPAPKAHTASRTENAPGTPTAR